MPNRASAFLSTALFSAFFAACGSSSTQPETSGDTDAGTPETSELAPSDAGLPSVEDAQDARTSVDDAACEVASGDAGASCGEASADAPDDAMGDVVEGGVDASDATADAPADGADGADATSGSVAGLPDGLYSVPVLRYGSFNAACKNTALAQLVVEKNGATFRVYGPTFHNEIWPAFWPMWFAHGQPSSAFSAFPVVADVDPSTGAFSATAAAHVVMNGTWTTTPDAFLLSGRLTFDGTALSATAEEQDRTTITQPIYDWSGNIPSTLPGQSTLPAGDQLGADGWSCAQVLFLRTVAGGRFVIVPTWFGDLMAPVTPSGASAFTPSQLVDPSCQRTLAVTISGTSVVVQRGTQSCSATAPSWFVAP